MPKLELIFKQQINFLAVRGTRENLMAVAYFRGEGGSYAGPARDFIDRGIRDFITSLSPADKRRFDEILDNVKVMKGSWKD